MGSVTPDMGEYTTKGDHSPRYERGCRYNDWDGNGCDWEGRRQDRSRNHGSGSYMRDPYGDQDSREKGYQ